MEKIFKGLGLGFIALALIMVIGVNKAQAVLTFGTTSASSNGVFTLTGNDVSVWSVASAAAADDLTVSVTGATDSSLVLSSTGTGADALQITTTAGGLDISVTGTAAGEDLDITTVGAATEMRLTSASAEADAIVLSASTAAGGIDITSNADVDITTTGAAGEDISLVNTGGSIILSATESAVDSILIESTLGGIDILASGATAEDIDVINTGGSININATEAVVDAIVLNASVALGGIDITSNNDIDITTTGAAGEDISVINTGGSIILNATESATDAVVIESTVGGIQILASGAAATEDILVTATGSSILLSATEDTANAVSITATTGGVVIAAGEAAAAGTADFISFVSESLFDNTANVSFTSQVFTSAGAGNLTPTSTFVVADNTGAEAALTLIETGAVDGQLLIIVMDVTTAAAYTIADTDGTANTSAALTLGAGDSVVFIYDIVAAEWVQLTTSNN